MVLVRGTIAVVALLGFVACANAGIIGTIKVNDPDGPTFGTTVRRITANSFLFFITFIADTAIGSNATTSFSLGSLSRSDVRMNTVIARTRQGMLVTTSTLTRCPS